MSSAMSARFDAATAPATQNAARTACVDAEVEVRYAGDQVEVEVSDDGAAGDSLLAPSVTRRLIQEFVRRPPETVRARPVLVDELTAREVEVLRMMARGLSNAEIASAFFVSETTVRTHLAHVLAKLGVRDRVQAVVFAYESGIVRPAIRPEPVSPAAGTIGSRPIGRNQPRKESHPWWN